MNKVKFFDPHPENVDHDELKKTIMELDGQIMTLKEGLNKLHQANKTSFRIYAYQGYLVFDVPTSIRGCRVLMSMPLISFKDFVINYSI